MRYIWQANGFWHISDHHPVNVPMASVYAVPAAQCPYKVGVYHWTADMTVWSPVSHIRA